MNKTVIVFGTFDGVHKGHKAIIDRAAEIGRRAGLEPVIYTFSSHPMAVFGKAPRLLMADGERIERLSGCCRVIAEDFTPEFAATSPRDFIINVLEKYSMDHAVAGFNYTFGHKGAGDTEALKAMGKEFGFGVDIVPPVLYDGEPVSSTRIRQAVEAGEIEAANEMLGYEYTLIGTVEHNKGLGRTIGFPTANIVGFENRVVPKHGVYAARVETVLGSYIAATNVGCNPTVNGDRLSVEPHILDFDGDIYGTKIAVSFVKMLRGERKFASVDELKAQIASDRDATAKLLKNQ